MSPVAQWCPVFLRVFLGRIPFNLNPPEQKYALFPFWKSTGHLSEDLTESMDFWLAALLVHAADARLVLVGSRGPGRKRKECAAGCPFSLLLLGNGSLDFNFLIEIKLGFPY